jgi:hypothetical protein
VRSKAIALASALGACLAAGPGMAQEQAAAATLTAEQMIEVERELYGSPDLREPCARPNPGEIVVCHTEPEDFRVESPTEAALRNGERPPGMPPNAAHLFDPPPCVPSLLTFCGKFGRAPKAPAIVDLTALPEPLTAEEAALVFRADDWPAEAGPARPAAASPADAP